MNSTTICVDTNIVVRLVAPDPHRDVLELWQEWQTKNAAVVAPALLRFEVVNAFHRMRVAGNIGDLLAEELITIALDLPTTYFNDTSLHLDALRIAQNFAQKAAYDAHYVALAEHLGAELWTADKRLYNAVHYQLDFVRLVE
jgi:predicted nucleic acid-binding protein